MENMEQKKDVIIIYQKGEEKMKVRLSDCIKLGLGIYIGYNLGRIFKYALLKKAEK